MRLSTMWSVLPISIPKAAGEEVETARAGVTLAPSARLGIALPKGESIARCEGKSGADPVTARNRGKKSQTSQKGKQPRQGMC